MFLGLRLSTGQGIVASGPGPSGPFRPLVGAGGISVEGTEGLHLECGGERRKDVHLGYGSEVVLLKFIKQVVLCQALH